MKSEIVIESTTTSRKSEIYNGLEETKPKFNQIFALDFRILNFKKSVIDTGLESNKKKY